MKGIFNLIMTQTEKLKEAYEAMKSGKIIEFLQKEHGVPCRCWISRNPINRKRYINFSHFGTSACSMSLSDLRWIAKVIGKCTTYDFKVVESVYGD